MRQARPLDMEKGGAQVTTLNSRPTRCAPSSDTNDVIVSGYVKRTPGRRGVWLLIVPRCPFCSRKHTHGSPRGLDTTEEHRLSHCRDGGRPYVIRVSEAA